jgi:hypothetical protein
MNLSPQHVNYCVHSTVSRIRESPRWDDEEGVAATIGTIMSLLVFLTAFGMFTNQFVPVWMSDNESTHMSQVIQQFTTIKSSIDIAISNSANSRIAPTPVFVPITLSSASIPVFASATAGILRFLPDGINTRPTFNVTYAGVATGGGSNPLGPTNDGKTGGSLDLWCPNRYFVEQHIIYENGAVILNQTDGEFIIAGPQFLVKNLGTAGAPSRVLQITQVSLQGSNVTIGGTGSKGVSAKLQFADTKTYNVSATSSGSPFTITFNSNHGKAWERFFNSTLNGTAGMTYGSGYTIHAVLHPFADKTRNYYTVTVTIDSVMTVDYTKATVALTIGELGL